MEFMWFYKRYEYCRKNSADGCKGIGRPRGAQQHNRSDE
jgi:hypothetical protein